MTRTLATSLLSACLVVVGYAAARSAADLDLQVVESDLEPSVTIQQHDNRVVEEYRINNHTYMLKIIPSSGAPYYLIDDDGSGDLEYRRDSGGRDIRVPQWTLISW